MGRDRWLGVGWPVRFGGRGFGQVEQQIFADEAARADVPLPAGTLQTVGPALQEHGTPGQQDFFLPKILAGEMHFAIGYTEPEAGPDLAALRTRAVRVGEDYVVDGQKIFTTGAVVVTSLDRARDLPHRPAVIRAAAQGAGPDQFTMTSYYRDDLTGLPEMGLVAGQLWRQARIGPADVRTAVLYDRFTPRAHPAGGTRLLRTRRGQGFHRRRRDRTGRPPAGEPRTAASWARPTSTA